MTTPRTLILTNGAYESKDENDKEQHQGCHRNSGGEAVPLTPLPIVAAADKDPIPGHRLPVTFQDTSAYKLET